MPDITMCRSLICRKRAECYRNPERGTEPTGFRQSWFLRSEDWDSTEEEPCVYFWPARKKN